jgi:hypothetical protein
VAVTCPNCHANVGGGSRFCPSCGHPLDLSNLNTGLADEATRLTDRPDPGSRPRSSPSDTSGWLGASGPGDRGRFEPGTVLETRYRVVGLLGQGGMGEVYRADDLRLGQPVALKFLPAALARDPVRLAQFHNEVRTARQVSHANVCRMYDIGETDGQLFLTMEYVDGEDLSSLLRRIGRLPEDKALDIARQICAGLAAAHERGVLHRDLKPANVMLDGAGKVRLMDFSLGAIGEVTDVRAGTPAYMAPEQLQGREVTLRSDIYALGLVLYELFTGRRVFDVKTLAELVERHQAKTITAPGELLTTLDPAIERAILRCLDPDPARRPASALAVSAALPGGDPLAAALAAGETPSPEMVAAAGGESAALSATAGVVLLVSVAALLVALSALLDRVSVVARVPLEKSRPVLVDRAADMIRSFGYTGAALDSASGFNFDAGYLTWAARHGAGADRWRSLSTDRPPAIRFWLRTSPQLMVPYSADSPVSLRDPPHTVRGMIRVDLDTKGRMVWFEAVPSMKLEPLGAHVNWDPLFAAAGLDRKALVESKPDVLPRSITDERLAWEGTFDDGQGKMRIEAAGYQGRPVMFWILGDWDLAEGGQASQVNPVVRTIGVLIVAAIQIGAALLARLNVRRGRGDRSGAFRAWAVAFGALVISWVIAPHVNGLQEVDRMFASFGRFLISTGVLYLSYLALEPYVRRTWPRVLITWSRLLAGSFRDPLVGRDLVVGTLGGVMVAAIQPLFAAVPPLVGWPQPQLYPTSVVALLGPREVMTWVTSQLSYAMQNGLIVMLMLSLMRQGLRKLGGIVPGIAGRAIGSNMMLAVVSVLIFVIVIKRNSIDPVYPGLDLGVAALLIIALLTVAFRFGLFALVWAFLIVNLTGDIGLTLDGSKPYAGVAWFVAAVVFACATLGVWMARAGEPIFGRTLES